MRAAKISSTTETRRHGLRRFSCVYVSLWFIFFCCALAGLPSAPAAFTQNQTRPRRTAQTDDSTTQNQTNNTKQQDAQTVDDDDEVVTINASEVLLPVTVRD